MLSCHLDEWLIRQSVKRIMIWSGYDGGDGAGGGGGGLGGRGGPEAVRYKGAYSQLVQYWAGGEHPSHCQDSFSQN